MANALQVQMKVYLRTYEEECTSKREHEEFPQKRGSISDGPRGQDKRIAEPRGIPGTEMHKQKQKG